MLRLVLRLRLMLMFLLRLRLRLRLVLRLRLMLRLLLRLLLRLGLRLMLRLGLVLRCVSSRQWHWLRQGYGSVSQGQNRCVPGRWDQGDPWGGHWGCSWQRVSSWCGRSRASCRFIQWVGCAGSMSCVWVRCAICRSVDDFEHLIVFGSHL